MVPDGWFVTAGVDDSSEEGMDSTFTGPATTEGDWGGPTSTEAVSGMEASTISDSELGVDSAGLAWAKTSSTPCFMSESSSLLSGVGISSEAVKFFVSADTESSTGSEQQIEKVISGNLCVIETVEIKRQTEI